MYNYKHVHQHTSMAAAAHHSSARRSQTIVQRQPQTLIRSLLMLPARQRANVLVSYARRSPVRLDYENRVQAQQQRLPQNIAGSLSAMDIGADPVQELEPYVQNRQNLKNSARQTTPTWMMRFIQERQETKYGSGRQPGIADPTAAGLISRNLQRGSGTTEAVMNAMLSSAVSAPDLFAELEPWLAKQSGLTIARIAKEYAMTSTEATEELEKLVEQHH